MSSYWSVVIKIGTKRDKRGLKGTILGFQFHLVRSNKPGQKGTKADNKGHIYSVNFLVRSKKSGRKGTKEDKRDNFILSVSFGPL